jgi:hypothetical protein
MSTGVRVAISESDTPAGAYLHELRPAESDHSDGDAPLARDTSTWFAQQLGEEWQVLEPGIYRHVSPTHDDLPAN